MVNVRFAIWNTTTFEWLILRKKGPRDQGPIEVVFGFYRFWSIQIHVDQTVFLLVGLVMFFNSMNLDTKLVVAILGQDLFRL